MAWHILDEIIVGKGCIKHFYWIQRNGALTSASGCDCEGERMITEWCMDALKKTTFSLNKEMEQNFHEEAVYILFLCIYDKENI